MDLHLNNPEVQAKLECWTAETGRPADELVEDVMAGYFEGVAQVRATLDSRYDDLMIDDEAQDRVLATYGDNSCGPETENP